MSSPKLPKKLTSVAERILTSPYNQLHWEWGFGRNEDIRRDSEEISRVSDGILYSERDEPVDNLIANIPVSHSLSKHSVERIKAVVSAIRFESDECDFDTYFDIGRTLLKCEPRSNFNRAYYMDRELWRPHYESGTNPLEVITKLPSATRKFERENVDALMDFYLENRDARFHDKHDLSQFIERFVPEIYVSKARKELYDKSTKRSVAGELWKVNDAFLAGGTFNSLQSLLIEKGYSEPFVGLAASPKKTFLDFLEDAGFTPNEKVTAPVFREMTEAMMGVKAEVLDGRSMNINGIDVKISTGLVIQSGVGLPFIAHGIMIDGEMNKDTVLIQDIRSDHVSDMPISDVHKLTGLNSARSLSESIQNVLNARCDNAPSRHQVDDIDIKQTRSIIRRK